MKKKGIFSGQVLMKVLQTKFCSIILFVKQINIYYRNALQRKKKGVFNGQELMKALLTEFCSIILFVKQINIYYRNAKQMKTKKDCQWSGIDANSVVGKEGNTN